MLLIIGSIEVVGVFIAYFILNDILGIIYNVSLTDYRLESALLLIAGIRSDGIIIISIILVIMQKITHQTIAYVCAAICVIIITMAMVNNSLSMALYAYILGLAA